MLGSYLLGDDAGLEARVAQAQRTGLSLQVVPSERYGMSAGYLVIVAGPFDGSTADRMLNQAQTYVGDALLRTLR